MKRLCYFLLMISTPLFSQVGIGTITPNASLEIQSTNQATPASTDGLLIPKVDEFPVTNPGASQDGMLLYATGTGSVSKGFYYWDNGTTAWVLATGAKNIDDLSDGLTDATGSSIFLGIGAGANDDGTANRNTGIGFNVMNTNIDGFSNIAFGHRSLFSNVTGNYNLAIGADALYNTTGTRNVGVGHQTMLSNATGNFNVALGANAGHYVQGDNNVFLGRSAGYVGTTHTKNGSVFIGNEAGYSESNSNRLYIENSNSTSPLIYGEFDNDIVAINGSLGVGIQTPEAPFHVLSEGTSNVQTIVAALESNTSNRPVLQFSESAAVSLNAGMSIEYNGTGSGSANRLVFNGVGGNPLFEFRNGGDFTMRGGDLIIEGPGADKLIRMDDDAGNPDRVLMRGTGTQNIFIGDIDDNGGDLYLRAGGTDELSIKAGTGFVGINTFSPNAMLDIRSSSEATPANTDGLLIPKIDEFPATNPGAAQDGIQVFATGNGSVSKGFYYWDSSLSNWVNSVGAKSLNDLTDGSSDTTGTSFFLGTDAGLADDGTNNRNTGVGGYALTSTTSGIGNSAFGSLSLIDNNTGEYNVAVGLNSLLRNTTGIRNTAIGAEALSGNLVGNYNVGIGYAAGGAATGNNNVFLGSFSGTAGAFNNIDGSVFIGYLSGYDESNDNRLYIENSNSTSPLIYGEFDNDIVGINGSLGVGTQTPGAPLHINKNGTAGNQTIVAAIGSDTSNRPVLQFSESTTVDLSQGMSLEYNGAGSGGANRMVINGVGGNPLFEFRNGGDLTLTDGDLIVRGTATDREIKLEDDAGNPDRVLMRQTGTQDIYVGDIDNNGGDTYIRAAGSTELSIISGTGFVGVNTLTPGWELEVNGNAAKPGGGSWINSSDRRLKQNINTYQDGLQQLLQIEPVTFNYNTLSGFDTSKEHVGVIAQELQKVVPYMVQNYQSEKGEFLSVDNSAMTYMLINAVKEQQLEIDTLKQELEELKNLIKTTLNE